MADRAHSITDKKLEQMERRLSAIYSRARKEIGKTWTDYLKEIGRDISDLQKEYEKAKRDGDKDAIRKAGIKLSRAKRERTLMDKHYKNLSDQTAAQISNVNKTALAYINGKLPEIYALNYNALEKTVKDIKGYSFELVDARTVEKLAKSNKSLLPYKEIDETKDRRWSTRKLNSEVLQGIIQGESMDKIANRLSNVERMSLSSAIRNARTMVTGAENRGREDSYIQAEQDGIVLVKEWMSADDDRTRDSHRDQSQGGVGGEVAEINEPFSNGLMYPGDPAGDPAEVYNCRCTMVARVKSFAKVRTTEKPKTLEQISAKGERRRVLRRGG